MSRQWLMGIANDKIWIKLEYDPDLNKVLKARLPGPARWDGTNKVWLFPLSWDTCIKAREMADKYDAVIKIAPDLTAWALQEKARQETIPDVQSMQLTDLPRVRANYPGIWAAITERPFQSVGAAFAARNRNCLVADQPGLGKTIQSIAAVIEADITGPILVVAPKNAAKLTWPQELEKWAPNEEVIVIGAHIPAEDRGYTIDRAMEELEESATSDLRRVWFLTSPNYVRLKAEIDQYGNYVKKDGQKQIKMVQEGLQEFFDYEWSAIIIDESHQTIAGGSGNKKKWSAQKQGLGALTVRENGLRLALSGTPFRGKEEYLWGQLNWLKPELFRSYWRWIGDHFDSHQDAYGMVIGNIIDVDKMYKEASTVMIRRTKAEVAADLPPKIYNTIWLAMEDKQAKAYEEIERKAQAELEGGILQTTGILAELTRLKQFAGSHGRMDGDTFRPTLPSNKFEWLVEFLDERGIDRAVHGDSDEERAKLPKIVVASQFSKLIDTFEAGLKEQGILAHKFTGDTPDRKREEIKDDFQNNADSAVRVLLLTTTAGGVSLTLDAADEMVILDETWNTSDQEQVEDRLHRLSRVHQVTIWKVFSRGTIEEHIFKANAEAEFNIKSVIDGARGQEVLRRLLQT
jgi:SNF2 family DNA or RNA helicase